MCSDSMVAVWELVRHVHQLPVSVGSVSVAVDLAICGFNQLPLKTGQWFGSVLNMCQLSPIPSSCNNAL